MQAGVCLINRRGGWRWELMRRQRRAGEVEGRMQNLNPDLVEQRIESTVPVLLENQIRRKAVVKHAESGAKDRLRWLFGVPVDAPGKSQARGKVGLVAELILRFEAQTITEGQSGTNL